MLGYMKVYAENKRARFDYEILEAFEAGISLTGHEAKSVRSGRINMTGSHAIVRDGEVFAIGLDVPSFQPNNVPPDHNENRSKKLLLKRREVKYLAGKLQDGLTLVPIKLYSEGAFLKLELALARGKKKRDKREVIKKRETDRDIQRALRKQWE